MTDTQQTRTNAHPAAVVGICLAIAGVILIPLGYGLPQLLGLAGAITGVAGATRNIGHQANVVLGVLSLLFGLLAIFG